MYIYMCIYVCVYIYIYIYIYLLHLYIEFTEMIYMLCYPMICIIIRIWNYLFWDMRFWSYHTAPPLTITKKSKNLITIYWVIYYTFKTKIRLKKSQKTFIFHIFLYSLWICKNVIVNHSIYLNKLLSFGFDDCAYSWFRSHLSGRVQTGVVQK